MVVEVARPPAVQVSGPRAEDVETYRLGTREGKVKWAKILFAMCVASLVVPAAIGGGEGLLFGLLTFGWILAVSSLGLLYTPYEVVIQNADLVSFVSVRRTVEMHCADITHIERCEGPPNGAMHHFNIGGRDGAAGRHSVSVSGGREDLFTRLTALSPAATVTTQVYDPD